MNFIVGSSCPYIVRDCCFKVLSSSISRILYLSHATIYGMRFMQGLCSLWLEVLALPAWSVLEVAMTWLLCGGFLMHCLRSSFKVIESYCLLASLLLTLVLFSSVCLNFDTTRHCLFVHLQQSTNSKQIH